jgi:hypothetical protein
MRKRTPLDWFEFPSSLPGFRTLGAVHGGLQYLISYDLIYGEIYASLKIFPNIGPMQPIGGADGAFPSIEAAKLACEAHAGGSSRITHRTH